MPIEDAVLNAYHQAVARHRDRTGESYPLVRTSCVHGDGTITDTSVHDPQLVARWSLDLLERPRVRLV